MKSKLLFLIWFGMSIQMAYGQKKYDIFYLSIGSEHYEQDKTRFEEGFDGLDNLEAASNSAKRMAMLFQRMGAISGRLILSEKTELLSKSRIFSELNSLIREVKKAKAKNPLIIVYYAGHGFSSGDYKTHFIPPGDFVKNPNLLDWEDWIEHSIAPLDIREILEESKISYLMLLDCCYEGELKQQQLLSKEVQDLTGTNTLIDHFGDVGNILNNLNTMTGPDPVIFSCEPGKTVPVELYTFGEDREEVAPLCRRIHLILEERLKYEDVTVCDLMVMLKYEALDVRTGPAFTTWTFDAKNLNLLWKRN